MSDNVLGVVAVIVGAVFCVGGYWAMRYVLALWGAFAGFVIGAWLVASVRDEALLAGALGWVVALLLALVFAACAYLYYAVAVVLSLASVGFALAAAAMTALGVSWTWLVILVAVVVGVAVGVLALTFNLPMVLLVLVSAAGGASVAVAGVMLLAGEIDRAELGDAGTAVQGDWWWYLLYLALFVGGAVSQLRRVGLRTGRGAGAWPA